MADSINTLQELVDLLSGAFGPDGRAVLVQNPTGQLTITRSGFNILKSVYSDSDTPRRKIIMNSVETLRETLGDGVKSFIFMVTAMLRSCVHLEGPYRMVKQLGSLQSRLSQLSFDNVNTVLIRQNTSANLELGDTFYSQIIDTFLGTRFPRPVSTVLGPLLDKWIRMCLSRSTGEVMSCLTTLYREFSNLCQYQSGGCRPVTDSCIKDGFILSRRPINISNSGQRKVIVLTFHDSDSDCGKFDELDIKCEVDQLLREFRQSKQEASNEKNYEILLITPVILSDLTLFNLRRANVAIVHGAPIDEVKYLFTFFTLRKLGESNPDSSDIIHVTFERNQDYLLLDLPDVCQLFICGPTKELCMEYAQTCHHALKLISVANQPAFRTLVVKGGGHFEASLHKHLVSKFDCRNSSVPHFVNRAELLAWHNEKLQQSDNPTYSCDIYRCFGEAFIGLDLDVLEVVLNGMLAIPRKLPQSLSSSIAVEPVNLRVGILLHALGTVITLIKIDAVLFTKCPSVQS